MDVNICQPTRSQACEPFRSTSLLQWLSLAHLNSRTYTFRWNHSNFTSPFSPNSFPAASQVGVNSSCPKHKLPSFQSIFFFASQLRILNRKLTVLAQADLKHSVSRLINWGNLLLHRNTTPWLTTTQGQMLMSLVPGQRQLGALARRRCPQPILSLGLPSTRQCPVKLRSHLLFCWSWCGKTGFYKHRDTADALVSTPLTCSYKMGLFMFALNSSVQFRVT